MGDRRVVAVTGGSFEGPRLKGIVEPGGSDWILGRPDGSLRLDVRLTLRTEDGALIGMTYAGYRHGPAAVIERLNRGEAVDPGLIYFRSVPRFETAAPQLRWLMEHIFVASGVRRPDRVELAVYVVR